MSECPVARRTGDPATCCVVHRRRLGGGQVLPATPIRVAILVYDEVEVLDACGPFEVFSVATRLVRRRQSSTPNPFEVITISTEPTTTVRARGGLALVADRLLADAPACDVVLVPGGVTDRIESDG